MRTIETTVDGVKRSNVDQINRLKPAVNDVVVVNYISPINGLILAAVSQCSWRSVVILIPSGKGLYVYNIWDILWVTLSTSSTPPQGEAVTDLASFKGKLVYIFAEGTTSNNRCVLPFVSLKLSGLNLDGFNLKTVLLKLSPPGFTTPLPTVTPIGYIQSLLTNLNPKSIVKVKIFNHEKEKSLNLNLAKKDFELNQLNSVGQDLNISLKEKFYIEFLKLNRK